MRDSFVGINAPPAFLGPGATAPPLGVVVDHLPCSGRERAQGAPG